jgi:hypothetical protein
MPKGSKMSSSILNSATIQEGKLTKMEINFVNNKNNFNTTKDHTDACTAMIKGNIAHENGNFREEGFEHRSVQENIKRMGGVGKYDSEAREVYGWNSLYIHHHNFIDGMAIDGYSFGDTFYYNGRGHYYLKQDALTYAQNQNMLYDKTGNTSIVAPSYSTNVQSQKSTGSSNTTPYTNDSKGNKCYFDDNGSTSNSLQNNYSQGYGNISSNGYGQSSSNTDPYTVDHNGDKCYFTPIPW